MRILTAVIISVLLTVAVLAIYLVPMLFQRPSPPPPLEELVPQLRVEEGGKKAVITEPLSWAEVYKLFLMDRASYDYVVPMCRDSFRLQPLEFEYRKLRVNYSDPCPVVRERFSELLYDSCYSLLLDNNCYWLKKLCYSTEKEWYITLAIVPPLAEKYASRYKNYSIWTIIHFENKSMVIEFYNAVDPTERNEFLNRYEQLVKSYPKVVVIMEIGVMRFWYEEYKLLEETGTPYIIVFKLAENTFVKELIDEHLEKYDEQLKFIGLDGALYVDGALKAVYTVSKAWCEEVNVPCTTTLDDLLKIE
ncbi:hypothetical protein Igag_1982 [Ignisphaera aggregans DSM 17230]|uniref:Uncharacterized protein n=1 Tax=Ignisphaera aggregans (strain DSM 17230 / JCM 13409 / AQ1.S1) TaxID=583356 RepID=E0STI8_IGNAA|nr:hypothetical protein Igag_1982 [Ignisphaera aggregans DSM 17230]